MTEALPCAHCEVRSDVLVCVFDDKPGAWLPFSETMQAIARLEAALAESERLTAIAAQLLQGLQELVQVLANRPTEGQR